MPFHPVLLLLLLLLQLSTLSFAGLLFSTPSPPPPPLNHVEITPQGTATATATATPTPTAPAASSPGCDKAIFPELPNKFLAPLGGNGKPTSLLVFIAGKESSWWCGDRNSLTAQASSNINALRSRYKKVYVANSGSGLVRSAFGLTKKSQLPAIGIIEPMTGKRYVLKNTEGDLVSLWTTELDPVREVLKRPKPLDVFDLVWVTMNGNNNINAYMREDMDLIVVMVSNTKQAKQLVKNGLRRLAQSRRGTARILLSRDPKVWQRYSANEHDFPSFSVYNTNKDTIRNYGRVTKLKQISHVMNQLASAKTYKTSEDVWNGNNYTGKFHRVSWSPHLYVMDDFLSAEECQAMIDNAYPTLSTGSLVGDNIDKRIKDLRFTVVPDNKITHVEQSVIDRIHDHTRLSEEHGEILQVSEYLPGQKYTLHPDSIDSSAGPHSMQRIVTFLMYLNDVDEGGATIFPRGNGQNQHMTRQDTEPWNLQHFCNMKNTLKIKPKKGRAIFWYNHHADLSWDGNTIHGACHVKQGIKYVAQRWIRWHTTQTPGFNPLQRALDQSHHLSRSLQEQERIAAASGSDQTKHLLTKVTNYESNIHSLKKEVDQLKRTTQDLNTRIRDLGDSVPLHVTPSNRASLWRTWVTSSVLFLPVLNNIQQSIGSIVCLFHGDEHCTPNVQSIYSSLHSPLRASDLQSTWHEGFSNTFRFSISRSPYARLVAFYDRLVVEKDIVSDMDQTWNKRLTTLGSFFEFIVGPVRMYHFSMTPTAGGDIGRHPGTRSQTWHLYDNDGKGNQLLVQYVARYKHLKEHLKDVCKVGHRFGVSKEFCNKDTQKKVNEQLKTMPNEDHDQTMKYFSSERVNLWDIVNDAFSNDFDKLGYAKVHSVEEYERIYVNGVLGPIVKE